MRSVNEVRNTGNAKPFRSYSVPTCRADGGGLIRSSQRAVKFLCLAWLTSMATNLPVWAAESTSPNSGNLNASTSVSNEGYFVLDWEIAPQDSPLTLQQSNSQQFSSVTPREVAGSGAATITGLADGHYYFRLLDGDQVVSNTVDIQVSHHSLERAGGFFLLGLALFSILIFTILHGNRKTGL